MKERGICSPGDNTGGTPMGIQRKDAKTQSGKGKNEIFRTVGPGSFASLR
jgi:hypothetical protein